VYWDAVLAQVSCHFTAVKAAKIVLKTLFMQWLLQHVLKSGSNVGTNALHTMGNTVNRMNRSEC
jgi:hypothetical protein